MYICLCRGITDEMIQKAKASNRSTKDILKQFGGGPDCGMCIAHYLEEDQKKAPSHSKDKKIKPFKI